MNILVSACLLGVCCRYDGQSKPCAAAIALQKAGHTLFPVCPEQLGGLPTPRLPCERRGALVVRNDGADATAQYARGAEQAVRLYALLQCDCALLKARSPMCGAGTVYDGTFSGALTQGDGVLAQALRRAGVTVYTEETLPSLPAGAAPDER